MKKIIGVLLILNLFCKNDIKYTKKINNNERFKYFIKNNDSIFSKKIYKYLNDTINKWINLEIEGWAFNNKAKSTAKWILSRYIYFNSKKDKLVALIPIQNLCEKCVTDEIYTILGQKIDSVWWFNEGKTYAIPRHFVTTEIHKPLSLEFLEITGISETMDWYYYEKDTTFCNFFDYSDSANNNHNCLKRILIINENYFNSIDWDCEHEDYIDYFYEKKYKRNISDTNKI